MNGEAGKGDTYRRVDPRKWSENYDRIFGKKSKPKAKDESRKQQTRKR
jgi:hypothetical protein